MKKIINHPIVYIAGAISVFAIFFGGLANSYGANINIKDIITYGAYIDLPISFIIFSVYKLTNKND